MLVHVPFYLLGQGEIWSLQVKIGAVLADEGEENRTDETQLWYYGERCNF